MNPIKSMFTIGLAAFILSTGTASDKEPSPFNEFYTRYKNEEGFISFSIPPGLLGLLISHEEKELKDLIKNIDNIRFLIYNGEINTYSHLASELKHQLRSKYKDLMTVNDGGEKVEFKIRQEKRLINELVMIVTSEDSFVLMSLEGEITPDQVKELSRSIDMDGISALHP